MINRDTDSNENNDSSVVIDLDDLGLSTTVKESTQLIQQSVFESLELQISEDLKVAKSILSYGEIVPAGSGLTYFIDGTRGAGKSTFLQYTYQGLFKEKNKKNIDESIKPLLFLDPSRIERSEMMLLHVLKHLKHLAKPQATQGLKDDRKYCEFLHLMEEMAGGLHLFVSDNSHLKDLDAELFLEQGLERAADSQKLREKLHETIDLVCKIQGVDALLIAVDDADTDAKSAIETLECIRKYLDTPRLVILVTGDMEMYSLLVQNHFVKTFARNSDKLNEDRHRQQLRMVEHLEEQYLLKLFPLQRRTQLKTLWQITKNEENKYQIKSAGKYISLQEWVDRLARSGLRVCSSTDKRLFTEFLLKQPVRSILQVLSIFSRESDQSEKSQINACSVALRSMALSSLYKYGVDVDEIAASELNALTEAVFDLSLRDGDPDTGVYLRPQSRDAALRNSFVALAADVARLCQGSLANSLTYMLAGPGSVSVYLQVARAGKEKFLDEKKNEDFVRIFKQYLAVGRKEDALNWAWRTTASLVNLSQSKKSIRQGVVGLRKRLDSGSHTITINSAINEAISNDGVKSYPSYAFSLIDVTSLNSISLHSSIYNIMGVMARLLILDVKSDQLNNNIDKLLRPLLAGLTISPPDWSGSNSSESLEDAVEGFSDIDAEEPQSNESKILNNTVVNIADWLKYCATLQDFVTPSATLLGKVWTRLYFSLSKASEEIRSSSSEKLNDYSSIMEIYAWCVINAFLVEENDHHVNKNFNNNKPISLNRKNPATSVLFAANKFSSIKDLNDKRLPLTFAVASCPLVLGFMNRNADYFNKFKNKLLNDNNSLKFIENSSCDETTWNLMSNVMFLGKNINLRSETENKSKEPRKSKSSGSEGDVTESKSQ